MKFKHLEDINNSYWSFSGTVDTGKDDQGRDAIIIAIPFSSREAVLIAFNGLRHELENKYADQKTFYGEI